MVKDIIVQETYYPVLVKNKGWIAVGNVAEAGSRTEEGDYLFHLDVFSSSEMTRHMLGFQSHFFGSRKELEDDFANSLLWGRKGLRTADGVVPKLSQDYISLREPDYELLMQGKGVLKYDEGEAYLKCGDRFIHEALKRLPKGRRRDRVVFQSASEVVTALSLGQQKNDAYEYLHGLNNSECGMVRLNWSTMPKTEFYWMPDGSVFELSYNETRNWLDWVGVVADPVRAREIAKRSEDAFAPEERMW